MSEQSDLFAIYGNLQRPAFDSASTDYRNAQHQAYLGDADLLAVNELKLIQARSRDLARNNGIAYAAEDKFVTKLGSVTVLWKNPDGTKHELMQELWDEFFVDPCLDGYGNGKSLQAIWNHDRFQSGEAISRMMIVTKGNDNRIPLKLQNIESEYLDINYQGQGEEIIQGNTRYGITFNPDTNKPEIYNFLHENYYGLNIRVPVEQWKRVPIAADDILHIFERRRSNQWRGIPLVAAILPSIYQLTDLRESTVSKQIAASAISWIIEQADAISLNAPGTVRSLGKFAVNDTEKKVVFRANGGSVQYTNPGERFNLVQSADIGSNYTALDRNEMQTIAAAYGIPYYMLSGNTDGLDFSSIRGILIEFRNKLEFIHHYINLPNGLDKLVKKFKAIAQLKFPEVSTAKASYQFPRNYGVDELKDAQTDVLEIQAGLEPYTDALEERNTTIEEIEAGREHLKRMGLTGMLDVNAKSNSMTNGNTTANSQTTGS